MDVLSLTKEEFQQRLLSHIEMVYGEQLSSKIVDEILTVFKDLQPAEEISDKIEGWSQKDVYLIIYGNSIFSGNSKPLQILNHFLENI